MILQIKRAKVQSDEEGKEGRKEEMEERVMGKKGGGIERKRRRKRNLDKTKKNKIVISLILLPHNSHGEIITRST